VSTWVVVLAGGIGSRFWPLSTPERPKQFLRLVDDQPLLCDTLARMAPLADPAHTLILTSQILAPAVAKLAPEIPNENIVLEPRPAGTAAALSWAASVIQRRDGADAVMISVHADWAVRMVEAYHRALRKAVDAAKSFGALVTVGVVPSRPDPGLGYICPGEHVEAEVFRVDRFIEKPDRARAEELIRKGCLWNSGIFVWRVGDFLAEVMARTPEIAPGLREAGDDAHRFFAAARIVSVDVGVLERSPRVLVIPGDFWWDDVGTWAALRRVRALDTYGNALLGRVHAVESTGNVVHAEDGDVVLFGVANLVVVSHGGTTLVTTVDRAADLKQLIESLPSDVGQRA
jgi:mannose-1-phosphate guanylyltransferase